MSKIFSKFHLGIILLFLVTPSEMTAQGLEMQSLDQVKTIYVFSMRGGMTNYLTSELVRWGRFQVTLNPHQADALLSDSTKVDLKTLMVNPRASQKTSSARGTLFLIDLRTENVIWATAKKPSESFFMGGDKSNPELAHELIMALRKDLEPGK